MRILTVTPIAAMLAFPLAAQNPAADGSRLLERCWTAMQSLSSVEFTTIEEQDDAMMRQLRGRLPQGSGETEVSGGRDGELLWASMNVDEDELVLRGDRTAARHEGGAWRPRRNALVNGGTPPFVFDPPRFFELVARLPAGARGPVRQEASEWRERPVAILSFTLDDDAARDVVLGGAIPGASSGFGRQVFVFAGGARGATPAPDYKVDIAVWVDPASGHAVRIRAAVRQKSAIGGAVQIQVAGAGGQQVEEEDSQPVEEFDASGNRRYVSGLPVRKTEDGVSITRFEVRLDNHGSATPPELDDTARAILGLPAK